MNKIEEKSLQVIKNQQVVGFHAPKKISKVRDARRLLASLIYQFQKGDVSSEYLKTLCYALIKYSELYKTESLETIQEKLSEMEIRFNELKKV